MGLLERVGTLVKANLNDLIDKAENPSKMIKQVILDMENQLLQVKTQVAISIADQHMLEKKEKEHQEKAAEWLRKAELAVDRGQDDLARAALERQKASERTVDSFRQQVADQRAQVTTLKAALGKLEQKLAEAVAKSEAAPRPASSRAGPGKGEGRAAGDRHPSLVRYLEWNEGQGGRQEAGQQGQGGAGGRHLEDRFTQLERDDEVDRLLA